ncbi:toprim domain-containing protein [Elioraea tepida]|uniref:Toprim domain-containing protein n=1 Tax=Elioraea tepida TaxID=2843330 RepID=A0A975U3D4_9PROT|nr:toprim domain-containing protein [Elioraea tepida]QXM24336.1 toprim domain-containing protein [Elioraea tepida]QXM25690.1 toprim domain-containing protein [Elioraea tepida]
MRDDTETLRAALRARAAEVAEALLGTPTFRSRSELRWGRRGSLSLAVAGERAGLWHDHERGEGGDLFDLIQRSRRCDFAEAVQFARAFFGELPPSREPRPAKPPPAPDDSEREAAALRLWHEARPSICNTPAEVYLRGRGIDPARLPPHAGLVGWPPTMRWHAETDALIVGVNDAETGLIRACQRILIAPDGSPRRRPDGSKLKLALGPIAGRAARFAWHPDPVGRWALAEGVETALAAAMLLGIPTWASLGASNLPKITPPAWAREAIICADHDDAGLRAAQEVARRLRQQGLQVRIIMPFRERADAADMLEVA